MSEKDYLYGIPLMLMQKFYPIPRRQFRDIDIHIPLDALQDEYDFTFEQNVVRSSQAYFSEKERLHAELAERCRQREEKVAEGLRKHEEERITAEERRKEEELMAAEKAEADASLAADAVSLPDVTENTAEHGAEEDEESDECSVKTGSSANSDDTSPCDKIQAVTDPVVSPLIFPTAAQLPQSGQPIQSKSYPSVSNGVSHQHQPLFPPHYVYQNLQYALPQHPPLQVHMCQVVEPPILKPQLNRTASAPKIIPNSDGTTFPGTKLNLSDFESDTASPFDSVALTSLDDRRELETVWANNANLGAGSQPPAGQAYVPQGETLSNMHYPVHSNDMGVSPGQPCSVPQTVIPPPTYYHQHQVGPLHSSSSSSYIPQQWGGQIGFYTNTTQGVQTTAGGPTLVPGTGTTSDSFTRVQFPFLSSLTQNNNRVRLREQSRLAERDYHQHQQQLYHQAQPGYANSPTPALGPANLPIISAHQQNLIRPSDIHRNTTPVPGSGSNPGPLVGHAVPAFWQQGAATPRFHGQQ